MSDELTPKQERFCILYVELGNATEAYAQAYDAEGMSRRTAQKRAGDLMGNGAVTGRIAALRAEAAAEASLSRAWVLERLMRNARIALGEEKVTVTYRPKDAEPFDIEVVQRDATAANQALIALGKTAEAAVFLDRLEVSGKDGAPLLEQPATRDVARAVLDILRSANIEQQKPNPEGATESDERAEAEDPDDASDDYTHLEDEAPSGAVVAEPVAGTSPVKPASPRVHTFNPLTGKLE